MAASAPTLAQLSARLGVLDTVHNEDSLLNLDELTPAMVATLSLSPGTLALWKRSHECRRCKMDPEADEEHHHSCAQFCTPFPPPPPSPPTPPPPFTTVPMAPRPPPPPPPQFPFPENCDWFCDASTCDDNIYPECGGCGALFNCDDAPHSAPVPPAASAAEATLASSEVVPGRTWQKVVQLGAWASPLPLRSAANLRGKPHEPPPLPPSMFSRLAALSEQLRQQHPKQSLLAATPVPQSHAGNAASTTRPQPPHGMAGAAATAAKKDGQGARGPPPLGQGQRDEEPFHSHHDSQGNSPFWEIDGEIKPPMMRAEAKQDLATLGGVTALRAAVLPPPSVATFVIFGLAGGLLSMLLFALTCAACHGRSLCGCRWPCGSVVTSSHQHHRLATAEPPVAEAGYPPAGPGLTAQMPKSAPEMHNADDV